MKDLRDFSYRLLLSVILVLGVASCGRIQTNNANNASEGSTEDSAEEPSAGASENPSDSSTSEAKKDPDVIFVPTPQPAVEKMLEMADIGPDDLLYDLGCGDGRIVVTAAKEYGAKAIGVDIDPERVEESRENVRKNDVEDLVTIKQADIFEVDFSDADVVTLYLLPSLNRKLMPKLAKLEPGTRIISYDFDMKGAKPEEVYDHSGDDYTGTIYKWVVPWESE